MNADFRDIVFKQFNSIKIIKDCFVYLLISKLVYLFQ